MRFNWRSELDVEKQLCEDKLQSDMTFILLGHETS